MKNAMFVALILVVAQAAWSAEYVVKSSGTTGYATIQSALDVAVPGDIVTVEPGTYVENLVMASGVILRSAEGSSSTVIDGNGDMCVNCEQCVTGTAISGFKLTRGGGYTGGGVRVFDYSDVEIYDNIFEANVTDYEGAGITVQRFSNALIHDNQFLENVSYRTSAITVIVGSSAEISNNFFKGNHSSDLAACIGVNSSTVDISWNFFVENVSTYGGTVDLTRSVGTISNNSFIRNISTNGPSCIRSLEVASIHNNLFAHNGGPAVLLGTCVGVDCNIFWDNETTSINGCDPVGQNSNLHVEALVCDPRQDDCAVSEYSPCLNNACGLVGANPVAGCTDNVVPTNPASWGSTKALFR